MLATAQDIAQVITLGQGSYSAPLNTTYSKNKYASTTSSIAVANNSTCDLDLHDDDYWQDQADRSFYYPKLGR